MPAAWRATTESKDETPRRRNRRLLHRDAARPILIHRPSSNDRTIHGISGGFDEAMRLLRRALTNSAAMSALRRLVDSGQAHVLDDRQVLEHAARQVARGRWVIRVSDDSSTAAKEPYGAAHDNAYREQLTLLEHDVAFMYLDTKGNVTVGIGVKLEDSKDTRSIRFVHRIDGKLASDEEKEAAFNAVHDARILIGRNAREFQSKTDLALAPGESARLFSSRLETAENQCRDLFKAWDDFPRPAQVALLDMAYNMGKGRALTAAEIANGDTEHGLYQYHKLRAAADAGEWLTASRECHRKAPVNDTRNNWTRDKFIEAAHLSPPRAGSDRATKL
ncbi:MAG TPA: hypothetical protein VKQ70_14795 [Caulobacteraceae bacterium]|jgi:GH24 family phage-related lysozyme (muramidase)|nr:hypothetical protein [Caulobacteraceae bacterium]